MYFKYAWPLLNATEITAYSLTHTPISECCRADKYNTRPQKFKFFLPHLAYSEGLSVWSKAPPLMFQSQSSAQQQNNMGKKKKKEKT